MNEVYATYWPKDPPARSVVFLAQPPPNADGLIEISMVAVPTGSERLVLHPRRLDQAGGPDQPRNQTGNTVFLRAAEPKRKGQLPGQGRHHDPDKDRARQRGGDPKEAGMTLADVVSSRVFLTDETTFQGMNEVYRSSFPSPLPARATVRWKPASPDDLLQISMTAVKDAGRRAFTTPNADGSPGTPSPNNSSAIQVGNRLYLAGITGNTATNRGAVKAQTVEVLARIDRTLKAAGFDWSNIVDGVVYLPNMTAFEEMNALYRQALTKEFPARATVGVDLLGADAAVEIMFTAVKE